MLVLAQWVPSNYFQHVQYAIGFIHKALISMHFLTLASRRKTFESELPHVPNVSQTIKRGV